MYHSQASDFFLVVNKLLNPSQHGFRDNHSCLSALLDVYDNLLFMLAENPYIIDMIYLHFSMAFDKVDFGILFHKMKDMGITGKLGKWFYHVLVNRTQFVYPMRQGFFYRGGDIAPPLNWSKYGICIRMYNSTRQI